MTAITAGIGSFLGFLVLAFFLYIAYVVFKTVYLVHRQYSRVRENMRRCYGDGPGAPGDNGRRQPQQPQKKARKIDPSVAETVEFEEVTVTDGEGNSASASGFRAEYRDLSDDRDGDGDPQVDDAEWEEVKK